MGTITAQSILAEAQTTLLDPPLPTGQSQTGAADGNFWTNAELFVWLNKAMEQIAANRMDAYVQTFPVQLIEGVEQYIDPDAVILDKLLYSMGQFGDIVGPTIREVEMDQMARISPSWTTDEPSFTTIHYMYPRQKNAQRTPSDPRRFYVWPPIPPQGVFVRASFSMIPPTLTSITQVIPLEDTWETAIYDFILWRAYEKNTKRKDTTKSTMYGQMFKAELGLEEAARSKEQDDE